MNVLYFGPRGERRELAGLRMKLIATVVFALSLLFGLLLFESYLVPFVVGMLYGIFGVARSLKARLDPLNDAPNALRVFLASAGGTMLASGGFFVLPSLGLLSYAASIFLNDEFQRRVVDSIRSGRRGGSVALLGIDGSGKSSHASLTKRWLEERGYGVVLMPFHRYIFVEKLSTARSSSRGMAPPRGGNPLRPLASLIDNLLLQIISSLGCRIEGRVVIYDRFMWSTYVKYFALGYPVRPLASMYLAPRPRCAIVFDVPVERSLEVIHSRLSHIQYQRPVLETERKSYVSMARERGYPVVDSTRDSQAVQLEIESYLSKHFPRRRRSPDD